MNKKELFVIKGRNGKVMTLKLHADQYGNLSRKGFEIAKEKIGDSLTRVVNTKHI